MSKYDEFETKMREVLFETVGGVEGVDKDALTDDTKPIADLSFTSTNFVRVTSALEAASGLSINFMKFRRCKTLGDMVEFMMDLYES